MLQDIEYKMYVDSDCELNIEELKILYEIDETSNRNLQSLRSLRDRRIIYYDFVKLFGEEHVECDASKININTIAFISIYNYSKFAFDGVSLPTYNLRFIYSDFIYTSTSCYIKNLENVEIVYGDLYLNFINNLDGLDNLRMVTGTFNLDYSYEPLDLSYIDYVNKLVLRWPLLPMKRVNAKNIVFPKYVEHLTFKDTIKKYNSFILPDGLKTIYVPNLNILNGSKINNDIDVYTSNNKIVSKLELGMHAKIISKDTPFSLVKKDIKSIIEQYKVNFNDRRNKTKIR